MAERVDKVKRFWGLASLREFWDNYLKPWTTLAFRINDTSTLCCHRLLPAVLYIAVRTTVLSCQLERVDAWLTTLHLGIIGPQLPLVPSIKFKDFTFVYKAVAGAVSALFTPPWDLLYLCIGQLCTAITFNSPRFSGCQLDWQEAPGS